MGLGRCPLGRELLLELLQSCNQLASKRIAEHFFLRDLLKERAPGGVDELVQLLLKRLDFIHPQIVQESLGSRKDDQDLPGYVERFVLVLLEQFGEALAAGKLGLGCLVEV
jgi:hypothetical protein